VLVPDSRSSELLGSGLLAVSFRPIETLCAPSCC
jgi:hypothetical protein